MTLTLFNFSELPRTYQQLLDPKTFLETFTKNIRKMAVKKPDNKDKSWMTRKHLVKVIVRNTGDKHVRRRVLYRLLRRYKPNTVQFFIHLNKRQISVLKRHYGDQIGILYGELLKRERLPRL